MPAIRDLVPLINEEMKKKLFSYFPDFVLYGVAELIQRDGEQLPYEIRTDGEGSYSGIDDTDAGSLYHRILTTSYPVEKEKTFGDGNNRFQTEIANMIMVVYGKRARLNRQSDEINSALVAGLPIKLDRLLIEPFGIYSCAVEAQSSELDGQSVFKSEYKFKERLLMPDEWMFSVRYTISTKFKKDCFDLCKQC